ncbi:flagellar biosynthetic protein FliR [Oleiphilus messinensis]|nr:flagellar biosynthetic protein FliR [Oleiphilus messinensis]
MFQHFVQMTDVELSAWVGHHMWPLFRVASFLMVVPFIGTQLVPMRIRLGLAMLIALLVTPLLPSGPQVDALSLASVPIIFQQVFIGVVLGFLVFMMVQLFVVAGQIIAMQMGLGFASMVDPTNGVSVPVLSQYFLITVTLLFLSMNGHLVMIEIIIDSFEAWPISSSLIGEDRLWEVIVRISWMFESALLIALPIVTSVLIVTLSFGVMVRAAPTLNVFSLGFPISLIFGLFVMWVAMGDFLPNFERVSRETFLFIRELQGLP